MTDFNFFQRYTVDVTSFPTDPQVVIPLSGNPVISLINEGNDTLQYSFDGETVHGDMSPGSGTAGALFQHRGINKIWFKANATQSELRVEATAAGSFSNTQAVTSTNPLYVQPMANDTVVSDEAPLPVREHGLAANQVGLRSGTFLPRLLALTPVDTRILMDKDRLW